MTKAIQKNIPFALLDAVIPTNAQESLVYALPATASFIEVVAALSAAVATETVTCSIYGAEAVSGPFVLIDSALVPANATNIAKNFAVFCAFTHIKVILSSVTRVSSTLTVTVNAKDVGALGAGSGAFNGNLLPSLDDSYKLGDATHRWSELHAVDTFTDSVALGVAAIETANTVFQLKEGSAVAATGNGPLFLITENASAPHNSAVGVSSGTTFGLKFLNTSYAASASTAGLGISYTSDGSAFFFNNISAGDIGYISAFGFDSSVTVTEDSPGTAFVGYYFDSSLNVVHDASFATGHDLTSYINLTAGKTLDAFESGTIFDTTVSGAGTVSLLVTNSSLLSIDAATVTVANIQYFPLPQLSGGGAIGTFNYITADDISGLTVSVAKNFINYAAGLFLVDSLGVVKAAGYKSSDGSAGATTTITTASLVGKTATFKNGLLVSFA